MNCNSNTAPLISSTTTGCNIGCNIKPINIICKEIIIPSGQEYISIEGEINSNKRTFNIPRYTENNIDLSDKNFSIVAKNNNGNLIIVDIQNSDKKITDNYVILTWLIEEEITAVSGNLEVEIHATGDNFIWKTKPATFVIVDGIDIEDKNAITILEKLRNEINKLKTNAYTEKRKVKDYLYELYYGVIDYDYANKYFKEQNNLIIPSACSSIRKGDFYGRNLDWIYNNQAEFIVKIPRVNGRYSTLSMCSGGAELTEKKVNAGDISDAYKIVPFMTYDGINEYGVVSNINVVPIDKGMNIKTTPTEKEEREICAIMLPRFVLDHFKNATDAVNYLKEHVSIYFLGSAVKMGYELHFMVADNDKTYLLEIIDNELIITDMTDGSNSILDGKPYMTNFYLSDIVLNEDGTVYTPETQTEEDNAEDTNNITANGSGLERYNFIADNYENIEDKDTMRNILTQLNYTNTYNSEKIPFWYTEYVGIDGLTVISKPEDFKNTISKVENMFKNRSREINSKYYGTWHTVHSSIYDIKNKKLYLETQEEGEELTYSFDYSQDNV